MNAISNAGAAAVDVFAFERDAVSAELIEAHGLAWLDADERARHQRLVQPRDRQAYLAAHVMLRSVLGQRLGVHPAEIGFERGKWGRPSMRWPAARGGGRIDFSLSHTNGLCVCAIADASDRISTLGVDAEELDASMQTLFTSNAVLALAEQRDLLNRAPADRLAAFCRYWALKEAYTKATGTGLQVDPSTVIFSDIDHHPRLVGSLADVGAFDWHFEARPLTPRHMYALAVACLPGGDQSSGVGAKPSVQVHAWEPCWGLA